MLGAQTQRLAAGGEDGQARAGCEQAPDVAGRLNDLLKVVQHQQQVPLAQRLPEDLDHRTAGDLVDLQHPGDGGHHELGIPDRCQRDEADPARELLRRLPRRFQGQAGLADAPGPGNGDEAHVRVQEEVLQALQLPPPPDERVGGRGKVVKAARRCGRHQRHGQGRARRSDLGPQCHRRRIRLDIQLLPHGADAARVLA